MYSVRKQNSDTLILARPCLLSLEENTSCKNHMLINAHLLLKHTMILCSWCKEYFINKGISISKCLKIWTAKQSTDWSTLLGAHTLNDCLGKAMIWRIGSTRKTWLTAINGEESGVWDAIIDKPNENSSDSSTIILYELGSLQVYSGAGKRPVKERRGEEREPW